MARPPGEGHEEIELQRGEGDADAAAGDLVARHIDLEVPDVQDLRRLGLPLTQARPDASHELGGLERLGHVVVRTRLEAAHHIRRVRLGREHHDRHVRLGSDELADLDAVDAGEHEVQQHQIGALAVERGQCGGAVCGERRLEAVVAQDDADHLGQRLVVVHHQDLGLAHPDLLVSAPPGAAGGTGPGHRKFSGSAR